MYIFSTKRTISFGRKRKRISPKLADCADPINSLALQTQSVNVAPKSLGTPKSTLTPRVCLVGFKTLSDFHRRYTSSFVRVDITRPVETEESRWFFARFWTMWILSIFASSLTKVVADETLESLPPRGHFNMVMFGFLVYSTFIEAFAGANLMRNRRHKWIDVITECEVLEERVAANVTMAQKMRSSARLILFIQGIVIAFNFGINAINDFGMGLCNHYNLTLELKAQVIYYTFSVIAGLIIPSNATLPRIWMMYFGRLFEVYIQRIGELLRNILEADATLETKVTAVDDLRTQLNSVRIIADMLSDVLGVGILHGYGYTIPLLCIGGYFVTMPDMRFRVRAYFAAFAFAHTLSVLVPIVIAAQLSNEIADLKRTIEEVSAKDAPPLLRIHLALLERTAQVEDFQINACGFFKVDLALFTSIMGASVTYTVMLAQTNNQIFQRLTAGLSLD